MATIRMVTRSSLSGSAASYRATVETEEIRSHDVDVGYQLAVGTEVTAQELFAGTDQDWRFYITESTPIVPGSVVLSIDGELWFDDGEGRLLRNYSTSTGTGTALGTISYTLSLIHI